jgi:UDP-N-acetylmuramoyl-tripeptide--D-alanyl-D-alanine ligase
LLGLRPNHRYAVTEMGMSHTGEIQYITRIAKPTVALINNAGNAHLEGLGSIEAVANAKGEIFEGLSAHGTAVINLDDAFAELWKSLAGKRKVITFGFDQSADVSADYRLLPESSQIAMKTAKGEISFELTIPGEHNVKNALAAASVAIALGISLPAISAGFGQFSGVKGRLQKQSCKFGAKLIDDTYNANPASMRAAVDVLSGLSGTRILVIGDMGELGARASELHREIGQYAKSKGIEVLFALGDLSLETVKAFGAGATHFESIDALVAALMARLDQQVTVLVKGSRFMRMERVVHALLPSSVTEAA